MLQHVIKKMTYHPPMESEIRWFVRRSNSFIQSMNADLRHIDKVQTFYCPPLRSCIFKLSFNDDFVFGMEGEFIYFLLDFTAHELVSYGVKFETSFVENGNTIKLIRDNKLHTFWRDDRIAAALPHK